MAIIKSKDRLSLLVALKLRYMYFHLRKHILISGFILDKKLLLMYSQDLNLECTFCTANNYIIILM